MPSVSDQILKTGLIPPLNPNTLYGASGLDPAALNAESLNDVPYNYAASIPNSAVSTLLGNTTAQNATASLPNLFGLGNIVNSFFGGFGSTLANGGDVSSAFQAALDSSAGATASNLKADSFWTNIFLRAVIIILGFIFTAIGLSMFGNKAATIIINEAKRSYHA